MGKISSPPPTIYYDYLSLGGLSSPLRIKKRTWWLERKISSLNSGVLEIVQDSASFSDGIRYA